jgi:pyridoxal phosphate enzyme (YggS family)
MDRVGEAAVRADRRPKNIIVVAVTKTASPDQIRSIVEQGHTDLAESRVQQLTQRVAQLEEFLSRKRTLGRASTTPGHDAPDDVRWHMVGHLQRNKVKQVLPLVKLVHSVDSLRLAEEIQAVTARADMAIDILLEINASGEPSKQGVAPPAALHLAEQIDSMVHVRLRGLMTMAPRSENPEDARPTFARTAEIFDDIRSAGIGGRQFNILSMGMTNDFEIAVEQGANVLRIGRALFGETEQ